ncbi:MAG: serine/threonine-protein kinase PknK, partial [Candidatus Binatia bacterium]
MNSASPTGEPEVDVLADTASTLADFTGTQRFEVLRCLGAGGMGTVYEVLDREHGSRIALKLLRMMDGESLLGFKQEFRDFQDLSHPNLVSVGELFGEDGQWFFTMELVDGVNFLEYVRPPAGSGDDAGFDGAASVDPAPSKSAGQNPLVVGEARLRAALGQLAVGLQALHDAGKVHRDIKPTNILVSRQHRVMLLDFGLAADTVGRGRVPEAEFVGTVDYMAPEQAAAGAVGPSADWYSLGVLLFEALTGRMPFPGSPMEVLINKQHRDAPSPLEWNPSAPEDLSRLCLDLLRRDPSLRPTGRQVAERLGVLDSRSSARTDSDRVASSTRFVGRTRELEQLEERFEQARDSVQVVVVHGESGLGKSALVRRFVRNVTERSSVVVALAGACYERESVPFKAVDGLIDMLSQYLRKISTHEVANLLPRSTGLLAEVFPVLRRVEAVADARCETDDLLDPLERRSRLFGALRELLARLAACQPLILVIDDLQWADSDSLELIEEVLCPPDAPRLLFIATTRGEPDVPSLREARIAKHTPSEPLCIRLERLSPDESCELAESLLRNGPESRLSDLRSIVQEADGHPLFIGELIRHAVAVGPPPAGAWKLEEALTARIRLLEPSTRRLLEMVCLASGRLLQTAAAQAAGVPVSEFTKQLSLLRVGHLVLSSGGRSEESMEPYHDCVRGAVLGYLDLATVRAHNRGLALAIESTKHPDPEALAVHWRDAGDSAKSVHFAILAGEKAARAVAFDRAAYFYRLCLEHLPAVDVRRHAIQVALAEALANAGRGAEAGEEFLRASDSGSAADAADLRRRASEQFLRSGRIEQGLAVLRSVLDSVGLPLAETPGRTLVSLLIGRAKVWLRGTRFRERDASEISARELRRIDTCWSAASALGNVDTILGADFQTRHFLLALQSGEPYRVSRALSIAAVFVSTRGVAAARRADFLLSKADVLAARLEHPHAMALARLMSGVVGVQVGDWRRANDETQAADVILRNQCTGVAWELTTGHMFRAQALFYMGRMAELAETVPGFRTMADNRGDLYGATTLRLTNLNTTWLVPDDVDTARDEARAAMKNWRSVGYSAQDYYHLLAGSNVELYAGAAGAAHELVERQWASLEKSHFLRV